MARNVIYITSNELDYRLLICDDAGPRYAQSMGWNYDGFTNLKKYLQEDYVIISDPRLSEEEYKVLHQLALENPATHFIAIVTDPCFEECIDKPLYKFLFRTTTLPNISYLSQYQPTEIVAFLRNIKGPESILTLNYPYQYEKQVDVSFAGRKNKILFSGSISQHMYPDRYRFFRKYRRSLWRLKVDTLYHPGYPGPGEKFSHKHVGNSYIQHLAQYRFMYLDGSRCNLELMKYSECAYAGCVPVGFSPGTFDDKLKNYVIPIDNNNLTKSLLKLFSMPQSELAEIAAGYRKEFSMQRDPGVLNKKFGDFINQKCESGIYHTSIL